MIKDMKYKIEDVYNIAEEMYYNKQEKFIKGSVSVNIYDENNPDNIDDIIIREYEINHSEGFKWVDGTPKTIINIDWDEVRYEVDEAFFNHFRNADKIWKEMNQQ